MKKVLWALFMLMICVGANAQKKIKPADVQMPANMRINMNEMMPTKYPMKVLDGTDYIIMRNDSIFANLPYVGDVHMASYGEGIPTDFDHPVLNMKKKNKKDGSLTLRFDVRHNMMTYRFDIQLYDNNRANVVMSPSMADMVTYMGEWVDLNNPENAK